MARITIRATRPWSLLRNLVDATIHDRIEEAPIIPQGDVEAVARLAKRLRVPHCLPPYMARRVAGRDGRLVEDALSEASILNEHQLAELPAIASAFDRAGVQGIFFKTAHLATLGLLPDRYLAVSDIDVAVEQNRFDTTIAALMEIGYRVLTLRDGQLGLSDKVMTLDEVAFDEVCIARWVPISVPQDIARRLTTQRPQEFRRAVDGSGLERLISLDVHSKLYGLDFVDVPNRPVGNSQGFRVPTDSAEVFILARRLYMDNHDWEPPRLKLLIDLARLITHREVDWDGVRDVARTLGATGTTSLYYSLKAVDEWTSCVVPKAFNESLLSTLPMNGPSSRLRDFAPRLFGVRDVYRPSSNPRPAVVEADEGVSEVEIRWTPGLRALKRAIRAGNSAVAGRRGDEKTIGSAYEGWVRNLEAVAASTGALDGVAACGATAATLYGLQAHQSAYELLVEPQKEAAVTSCLESAGFAQSNEPPRGFVWCRGRYFSINDNTAATFWLRLLPDIAMWPLLARGASRLPGLEIKVISPVTLLFLTCLDFYYGIASFEQDDVNTVAGAVARLARSGQVDWNELTLQTKERFMFVGAVYYTLRMIRLFDETAVPAPVLANLCEAAPPSKSDDFGDCVLDYAQDRPWFVIDWTV